MPKDSQMSLPPFSFASPEDMEEKFQYAQGLQDESTPLPWPLLLKERKHLGMLKDFQVGLPLYSSLSCGQEKPQ